jgi:hypothetical protein
MSALSLVTTPPKILAEVVTNSARLLFFRSSAGLTFKYGSFLQSSVRRGAPGPVWLREIASWKKAVIPPDSALVLSGIPGTGRFLF